MGRPEKWKDEYVTIAKKACDLGATDMDLAEMLDVSLRTISYWRANRPEFAEALRMGKDAADERVVSSLFNRAMGYSHPDTDIRVVDGAIMETPMIKHYPPDTTAAIFWLKNRKPDQWRDKQEIEHSGQIALTDRILAARKRAKPEE